MPNPRALVKRRSAVQNTRKITSTMELVATAKLSRAQHAAVAARPYAQKLQHVIGDLARAAAGVSHPLLEAHAPVRHAVVLLLTSDRGLCGAFNGRILEKAEELRDELARRHVAAEFIIQGKKGVAAFKYRNWPVARSFAMVSDKPSYARADELGSKFIELYQQGDLDEVYIVFSSFRSMVSQVPTVEKILPLSALGGPGAGAHAGDGPVKREAPGMGFIYHPGPEAILRELLPLVVKTSIFTAMLENCAGEHAARRIAMKNATDAADEMIRQLTTSYNRARQGKITQEIAEIVGGANAL